LNNKNRIRLKQILFSFIIFLFFTANLPGQGNINFGNKLRLAESFERVGEYARAEQLYLELLQMQPFNSAIVQSLNKLYLNQKDYSKSVEFLTSRIKTNPVDITLYGLLGNTYYIQGEYKTAFDSWEDGIQKNPGAANTYKILSNFALESRAFDKAAEFLNRGKEIVNDPKMFAYDLGFIYSTTMKFSKAAEEYCNLLLIEPQQLQVIKSRINQYIESPGAADQTFNVALRFSEENSSPVFLDLLSFLYVKTGELDLAFEAAVKYDERSAQSGNYLFLFAQEVFRSGYYDLAAKSFKYLVEKYPASAYYAQSRIYHTNSLEKELERTEVFKWKPFEFPDSSGSWKYNDVASSYSELIELFGNSEPANAARFGLADILFLRKNNPGKAYELYRTIFDKYPFSSAAVPSGFRLAEIDIRNGNIESAKLYLEKVIAHRKSSPDEKISAKYFLSNLMFKNGEFNPATQILEEVANNLKNENANDAIGRLMLIKMSQADSSTLQIYANALKLADEMKFEAALEKFSALAENDGLMFLNEYSALGKSQMLVGLGRYQEALTSLKSLYLENQFSLLGDKALLFEADIYYYGLNEPENAQKSLNYLLEKFPNSLYLDISREKINLYSSNVKKRVI